MLKIYNYRSTFLAKNYKNAICCSFSSQEIQPENKETADDSNWFNVESGSNIDERVVPKPISYRPDHLPQLRKRQKQKPWWKFRYFVDVNTLPLADKKDEYTEKPEYPPIFMPTNDGKRKEIRKEWYRAIRNLPTAEQKIYEITKHYGHLSFMIDPIMPTYNALPLQQYITKTNLINGLPDQFSMNNNENDNSNGALKEKILKIISTRLYGTKSRFASIDFRKTLTYGHCNQSNRLQSLIEDDLISDVVQLILQNQQQHQLIDYHIDYNPYCSQSWWLNNCPIPFKKSKWFKDNDHVNQIFTYRGNHSLHVRSLDPLISTIDDNKSIEALPALTEDSKADNNEDGYNLLRLGVQLRRHNIMSLPGFWPSKSNNYDHPFLLAMNYEALRHRQDRFKINLEKCNDDQDVCDGMAMTSGFAWLSSMATNLGFTIYDPLLYPLITNIIITDGKHWSFYLYQLNNHCFHDDIIDDNSSLKDVKNVCWSSGIQCLFESYDAENDKLINVNENVLNLLINMLKFNTTTINDNDKIDYRPYLSNNNNLNEQEQRELSYSLRRKFANQIDTYVARRKKTNLWETIYKQHKESFMDLKRIRPKIEMKHPPFFK